MFVFSTRKFFLSFFHYNFMLCYIMLNSEKFGCVWEPITVRYLLSVGHNNVFSLA